MSYNNNNNFMKIPPLGAGGVAGVVPCPRKSKKFWKKDKGTYKFLTMPKVKNGFVHRLK